MSEEPEKGEAATEEATQAVTVLDGELYEVEDPREFWSDGRYDQEYQFSFFPGEETRYHLGHPILGREVRITGAAMVTGALVMHERMWDQLEDDRDVLVRIVVRPNGDGFAPLRDSDGDIIGWTEYRKIRVVRVVGTPEGYGEAWAE